MANNKTTKKADAKTAVSTTETNTSVKETTVAAAAKEEPKTPAPAAKAEVKTEAVSAPKDEAKTAKKPGRKPGRKPGAKTAAAAKAADTSKRTSAKKTEKTAKPSKPAKTAGARKASKAAAKAEVQTADAAPKRRGGRKPKPLTIEDLCAKLSKKIDRSKAAAVSGTIATDVEVWGWDDGSNKHLFIEVADGRVRVEPYNYEHSNFNSYISFADAKAFVDGKLTLKDALALGKLNAIGVVGDALKLASIF